MKKIFEFMSMKGNICWKGVLILYDFIMYLISGPSNSFKNGPHKTIIIHLRMKLKNSAT